MRSAAVPEDTTPEAFGLLVARWRALGVAGRWKLTDELCRDLDRLATAGIRLTDPTATDEHIMLELVRRRYGDDLAQWFRAAAAQR